MAVDCFYPQIDVVEIVSTGERYPLASTNVEFYNITQGVTIDTIATDAYGILAEGGFDSGVDAAAFGETLDRGGLFLGDGDQFTQFFQLHGCGFVLEHGVYRLKCFAVDVRGGDDTRAVAEYFVEHGVQVGFFPCFGTLCVDAPQC